ncbi:hypothetical protein KIPB_015090, partial [Kipferlia bialata]
IPDPIHLCSEWSTPQDRGMMLGLFQIGNSVGRSLFTIIQGFLYDWNFHASWFVAYLWPALGFIGIKQATVPVEHAALEAAALEQKERRESHGLSYHTEDVADAEQTLV